MSRRRATRGRDPHWITLRYAGKCTKCGASVPAGAQAFYFPNGRSVYGQDCCGAADDASRQFEAERFDDEFRGAA